MTEMRPGRGGLPVYWSRAVVNDLGPEASPSAYRVFQDDDDRFATIVEQAGHRISYPLKPPAHKWVEAILFVCISQRLWLERHGVIPRVCDSPWQFKPSLLASLCPQILLSEEVAFLPAGNLARQPDRLPDRFFIRPDSGDKAFPGQVIKKSDIGLLFATHRIRHDDFVMIGLESHIDLEVRCFVSRRSGSPRIVTASPYSHAPGHDRGGSRGNLGRLFTPAFDADSEDKIQRLLLSDAFRPLAQLLPDMFVADFAFCGSQVRLIEINSVSTSGSYDCNVPAIIAEINALSGA